MNVYIVTHTHREADVHQGKSFLFLIKVNDNAFELFPILFYS